MKRARSMLKLFLVLLLFAGLALVPVGAKDGDEGAREADDTLAAVVRIRMKAVPDARTNPYLGAEREGSGIVIDDSGHVLTIGYIVVEAESIEITTADGRTVPATLAGYDNASGFALLQASLPLGAKPMAMGSSAAVEERDPVMVLPYGGRANASLAFVVSRREFSASWEYLVDSAIFTTPPIAHWQGSALIDREGRLVGLGYLLVGNSAQTDTPVPGNLFLPIDLVKPILPDLIAKGRAAGPARPYLGLATDELRGHLFVARVSPEGPAEAAGLKTGDIVIGVGADPVNSQAEFYRKVWSLGPAGVDVPLKVLQGVAIKDVRLRSMDRSDYLRKKPAY
jgi:S1-C subfamily serine protease